MYVLTLCFHVQELRLPIMLDEAFAYLDAWALKTNRSFEVNTTNPFMQGISARLT